MTFGLLMGSQIEGFEMAIQNFLPCPPMKGNIQRHEQLWQKVLQNDMQALEAIYRHFYPSLFHYLHKLTGQQDMAEDVVQDTFLYMWQHRQQISEIKSLQFYLFRSVRNNCLKLIQKNHKLGSLEEANNLLQLTIFPEELHLTDTTEVIKKQIQKALKELSSRQREIIFLKFYNNLDYEEIAEVLGINYQSVVNHVHRGIIKLRESKTLAYILRS